MRLHASVPINYICTTKFTMLIQPRFATFLGLFLIPLFFASCNKELLHVLVENPNGNSQLVYQGAETPENLVKEIRFYPNGDTLSITPMRKRAVNGMVTNFYPANKTKDQTMFVNGVANGIFKKFDNQGVLVIQGTLKNGQKDGVWTTWYDEVQKQEERTYANNQPHGKWTYWYIDGEVKREEVYELGKIIEEK